MISILTDGLPFVRVIMVLSSADSVTVAISPNFTVLISGSFISGFFVLAEGNGGLPAMLIFDRDNMGFGLALADFIFSPSCLSTAILMAISRCNPAAFAF